jgi:hypothetical protein
MNQEIHLNPNRAQKQAIRRDPGFDGMNAVASAAMVNRAHRVVRERAKTMQARKTRIRSLWVPLAISTSLLAVLAFAVWNAFEEYEVSPAGLPDASQTLVLMLWSFPISAMLLAIIWFRRNSGTQGSGSRSDNERA